MTIRLHAGDLPADLNLGPVVAIDTETLGLEVGRDRLCLVQLSRGDGVADLVQIAPGQKRAPNLEKLLADPNVLKLFHFGRFDIAMLCHAFGVMAGAGLLHQDRLQAGAHLHRPSRPEGPHARAARVEISKQQQSSDWGAETLSEAQLAYAASDVLHLHALRDKLDAMLEREGRDGLARAAFAYLPERARLDLAGFAAMDIFAHASP